MALEFWTAALLGLGGVGGALHALGVRVGPGRALTLGLLSRLFNRPRPRSQRVDDVNWIRDQLHTMKPSQYIVVSGPKGVGKTCAVGTALEKTWGVVDISVGPGEGMKEIMTKGLMAIARTGLSLNFLSPFGSARRVLFYYNLVARRPPILVIHITEIPFDGSFPKITPAVRSLADMGIRVIVDSSDHSLPPDGLETIREIPVPLQPMSKETVMADPEFRELFDELKKHDLDGVAWTFFGGNAAELMHLSLACSEQDVVAAFSRYLGQEILRMIVRRNREIAASHPNKDNFKQLLEKFRTQDRVDDEISEEFPKSVESKILRSIPKMPGENLGQYFVQVPCNPIMAFVLRYNWKNVPTIDDLKKLAKSADSVCV